MSAGHSQTAEIRLVAIDLDGTLLNDSKRVSEQTAEALRCLPARGVRTVIASARPPRSVRHIYRLLNLDTWQINYNGAMIWDDSTGRAVFHQPMHGELVQRIAGAARSMFPDVLVSCEVADKWYTDFFDERRATFTTETGKLFKPDLVAPIEQFCAAPITKLMLLGPKPMMDRLETTIRADFAGQVNIVHSDPDLLQIMDHRVSKAAALRVVAEHYAVPMPQVMAIGDALNDMEMLAEAGAAIAMANAPAELKAIADWVAPSNNHHGVHAALRRYGLCE